MDIMMPYIDFRWTEMEHKLLGPTGDVMLQCVLQPRSLLDWEEGEGVRP